MVIRDTATGISEQAIKGLTTSEPAAALGVPDGTLKAQFFRARMQVTALMRQAINSPGRKKRTKRWDQFEQAAPTPLALLLPLRNAEGSDEMASRRSQSRASNGSSRQRGIDHEITNFHPVVSHLAGPPPMDRVPVDAICALAHALDWSPNEAWSKAPAR